jgi:CRP-like cAMP-binding protein
MTTHAPTGMLRSLPAEHRERLMTAAREVAYPQGARLFEEGGRAGRFWIVRTGTVALDLRIPGRRAAVIETLGHDELVGWSWLYGPHTWHLGAEATSPVRAHEFDAEVVRGMCRKDPAFGFAVAQWVGDIVAHRLCTARTRLLDLYAPYGAGAARWTRPAHAEDGRRNDGDPLVTTRWETGGRSGLAATEGVSTSARHWTVGLRVNILVGDRSKHPFRAANPHPKVAP